MDGYIEFETPENVKLRYPLAGLGTRFLGWITDQLLMLILMFVLFLLLMILASPALLGRFQVMELDADGPAIIWYGVGMLMLAHGLGSFAYFGLFELLMRGQTPGKRSVGIRVVKADGFALDPVSILVRNLFRVADQLPIFWFIPLVSQRQQRLGDMISGTLIVTEEKSRTGDSLIEYLRNRPVAGEPTFHFHGRLQRLGPAEWQAAEQMLDRVLRTEAGACAGPLQLLVKALSLKLNLPAPEPGLEQRFLEELLTAELRRRDRQLA